MWNKYFPGLTSLEIIQKTPKDLQDQNVEPENFEDRIIFISMTSIGRRESIQQDAVQIPNKSRITQRDSREDTGHSQAQAMKRNGTELSAAHLVENGIPSPH